MEIFINTQKSTFIVIKCEENERINGIKTKIKNKLQIPTIDQILIYNGKALNGSLMLKDYKIHNGSMINIHIKRYGGIIPAKSPSPTIGDISVKYDNDFLIPGELNPRIIRNSNTAPSFCQHQGDCYAYAASEVYHNAARRIHGARKVPSVRECFNIARYSIDGGQVTESLKRLEDHYKLGILWEKVDKIEPKDSLSISAVACFTTSEQGWFNVSTGNFLTFAEGSESGGHAILVEGYDFQLDCFICKNSWGNKTAAQYINFSEHAAHSCYFIKVYYTLDSIKGKTIKKYNPKIGPEYIGRYNGHKITCARMDKKAAFYETNYICEFHPEFEGDLKYVGYDLDQWIKINLNREKGQPLPNTYYYNLTKKRIWNEIFNMVSNPLTINKINREVLRESQLSQARQKVKDRDYKFSIIKREKRGKFELNPHIGGMFSNRIFRKTNLKNIFIQDGDYSYAYSAAYVFVETANRMYGIKYIPKFDECLKIAAYNGENEGDAAKSIRLLEKHFHLGIRCEESEYVSPEEALKISIIAKINTSNDGYYYINKGNFLTYKGESNYRPEWAIIDGIDTSIDCFICKKTWDIFDSRGHFNLGFNASHCNKYIKVYFYLDDIIHKTIKEYKPRIIEFKSKLDGQQIRCARMNEEAAKYETNYDYVFHPKIHGDLKYIGYNIDDLIKIKLNRSENQEFSLHHYINLNKREEYKYHSDIQNRKNNVSTIKNILMKKIQKIHNKKGMSINPLYNIINDDK